MAEPNEVPVPPEADESSSPGSPREGPRVEPDPPQGGSGSQPEGKSSNKKSKGDPNARLREELRQQKEQREAERQRQSEARARRNFERLAKAEELRAREERRRMQAEDIERMNRDHAKTAANRVEFEKNRDSSDLSTSEESIVEPDDVYEDLPGEVHFLAHFKEAREHSPTRQELMLQVCGPNQDSIQAIVDDIAHAELELSQGAYPRGGDLDELLGVYQDIWGRITHLCHAQGSFAKLRGLARGEILMQLDQELKVRTEGLLQAYGRMRNERRQARLARRDQKQRQATNGTGPRTRIASEPTLGPATQREHNHSSGTHRSSSLSSTEQVHHTIPGNHAVLSGRVFGNSGPSNSLSQPPGGAHAFLPPVAQPVGSAQSNNMYVPHYLKPLGEGAGFYATLPEPWNVHPEHSPTSLTHVPQMQKAGCFTEFTGEIQTYRTFRSSFIDGCHRLDLPISSKYMILKSCLTKHKILTDLINTTCPSAAGYRTIIFTLEERYGHAGILLNHHLHKLSELPRIRETVIEDVDNLIDTANGYNVARMASGAQSQVDPTYYNLVKGKLPDKLRREYAKFCREEQIKPTDCNVGSLLNWIKIYVAEPLRLEPPTKRTDSKPDRGERFKRTDRQPSQGNSGSGFQPGPYDGERKYNYYSNGGENNSSASANKTNINPSSCILCKSTHRIKDCPEFLAATLPKRFEILKELNCCFRCLTPSHIAASCPYQALCTKCKGEHHSLLHNKKRNPNLANPQTCNVRFAAPLTNTHHLEDQSTNFMPRQEEFLNHARMQTENKDYTNYLYTVRGDSPVSLQFQWVTVTNPKSGLSKRYNLMEDPGAQFTAISRYIVDELQLKGVARSLVVEGVGGVQSTSAALLTDIIITSSSGLLKQTVPVRAINTPLGSLQATNWNHFKHYWPHLSDIEFPTPVPNQRVDIIIGLDQPHLTEPLLTRRAAYTKGITPSPIAIYNRLGWTAGGPLLPHHLVNAPMPSKVCIEKPTTNTRSLMEAVLMDSKEPPRLPDPVPADLPAHGVSLQDLVKLLPAGTERPPGVLLNAEDRAAMHKMYTETVKLPNGHYQVPVLWLGAGRPPNNRKAAQAEWNRNLVRLKDAGMHQEFDKIIKHWLDSDYIEELPAKAVMDRNAFYLPFFAVLRPDKPTSPVRIVMNGKAVFGPNKISLNDCIARGPKLLNNLVEVLMKFRQQPIGVTCDIKEMFLNVYMPPEDWDWHRFFYTLPGEDNSRIFRAKVHQFGSRGSPDSTCFAMKLHALINIIKLALAALAILDHCIVDDGLIPIKDREYGLKLVTEMIDFAAGLGMKVHKWASNDPSILPPGTPQRDLVELNSMDLEAQYPEGKALGIVWHTKTDEMTFAPLKPTHSTQETW